MELKKYHKHLYTSISHQLPADGRGPFAGSFLCAALTVRFAPVAPLAPVEPLFSAFLLKNRRLENFNII